MHLSRVSNVTLALYGIYTYYKYRYYSYEESESYGLQAKKVEKHCLLLKNYFANYFKVIAKRVGLLSASEICECKEYLLIILSEVNSPCSRL